MLVVWVELLVCFSENKLRLENRNFSQWNCSNIQHPTISQSVCLNYKNFTVFYLYEALADVTRAEGLVAAGGQRQSWQEEEQSGGGGSREDQPTEPHPDGSPARHREHLRQHRSTGQGLRDQGTGRGKDK